MLERESAGSGGGTDLSAAAKTAKKCPKWLFLVDLKIYAMRSAKRVYILREGNIAGRGLNQIGTWWGLDQPAAINLLTRRTAKY